CCAAVRYAACGKWRTLSCLRFFSKIVMASMSSLDCFHRANADYLDRLYARYERDPNSVDSEWQAFFAGFDVAAGPAPAQPQSPSNASRPGNQTVQAANDLVHSYLEPAHG